MKLEDFYNSDYWQGWDSDNRNPGSCGIILNDPDRYDRIAEAAEYGAEGSTHAEIINDWQECLDSLTVMDPEFDDPEDCITDLKQGVISQADYDSIQAEIEACYEWHESNGSLDTEIG